MKLASLFSKLLIITLAAATFACSGGGAGSGTDAQDGSGQKAETVSLEQQLRDANVKYAASVNADVATIEAKYKELIGNQFPEAFSANFLKFLIETNPSFANAETVLQDLDARFFLMTLGRKVVLGASRGEGEESSRILEEVEAETSEETKQKMKDASDQFSAALVLSRNILLQSAAIYHLNLTATEKDSFAVPEKFIGDREIPAELKDILTQPLFAASFKDKDTAYSFFEIFALHEGESTGGLESLRRTGREIDFKIGKYNYLPASENFFHRASGGMTPVRTPISR